MSTTERKGPHKIKCVSMEVRQGARYFQLSSLVPMEDLDAEAERELVRLGEPLGTLWTRATEKAARLALNHACSRGVENHRIDKHAASWACEISAYLTRRLAYLAVQWVSENPFDARRMRILRLITDAGPEGLTRTELYRRSRSFATRERADILEALQLCGDVTEVREQTGGAPRVRYIAARPC